MKALFLGHFAATVAPQILAKVQTSLESSILDDDGGSSRPGLFSGSKPNCRATTTISERKTS
jgi:hypothetical protein